MDSKVPGLRVRSEPPYYVTYWDVPRGQFEYQLRRMVQWVADPDVKEFILAGPSDVVTCIDYVQGDIDSRRRAACLRALGCVAVVLADYPVVLALLLRLGVDPDSRWFDGRTILASALEWSAEQSMRVLFEGGAQPSQREIDEAMTADRAYPSPAGQWILGWFREFPDPGRRWDRRFENITGVTLDTVESVAWFLRNAAPADLNALVADMETDIAEYAAFEVQTDRLNCLRHCLASLDYAFFIAFIRDRNLIQVLLETADDSEQHSLKHAVRYWGATPEIRFGKSC